MDSLAPGESSTTKSNALCQWSDGEASDALFTVPCRAAITAWACPRRLSVAEASGLAPQARNTDYQHSCDLARRKSIVGASIRVLLSVRLFNQA